LQLYGTSYLFVRIALTGHLHAVIANNADVCAGRISRHEWERRAMKIAYQFPQDSGIRAHLREQEGLRE